VFEVLELNFVFGAKDRTGGVVRQIGGIDKQYVKTFQKTAWQEVFAAWLAETTVQQISGKSRLPPHRIAALLPGIHCGHSMVRNRPMVD